MARFLVIDDDNTFRQLMVLALEGAGHTVVQVGSGREAVMLFQHKAIDVVITDLIMPTDSIEMVVELSQQNPRTPFILISGLPVDSARTLEVAQLLDARQTLAKPFKLAALLSAAEAVLAELDSRSAPSLPV